MKYILRLAIALSALPLVPRSIHAAEPAHLPATTALSAPVVEGPEVWKDPAQPIDQRVQDLVRRMTLEEKASQVMANPPAIPRLGIPAYSHRNECLHGVANGVATVFPQAIGMAATWDTPLIQQEADAIATEGRAKHNDYAAKHNGDIGEHNGVNFYSPNINIFRDPRWGRGQETYGEDPFLTAQIGIAFVKGLQGNDPDHVKAMACAKHFAVHSGPEKDRHHMNMAPSEQDLYDTYLPAFEALIKEAKVGTVMGAYSALNGKPCCANPWLLNDLLRKRWGFDGLVFSDGGAIGDIWAEHHYVPGPIEAAAAAVQAGCDVSSGGMQPITPDQIKPGHANAGIKGGRGFQVLPEAVRNGLITEREVDTAVARELTLRMRLGLFDPPATVPWSKLGLDQVDSPEHRQLALKVARESIVLLKNDGVLPLEKGKYRRIAVIGPNADAAAMQNGNYAGKASRTVTILEGIRNAAGADTEVLYEQGSRRTGRKGNVDPAPPGMAQKAIAAARSADLILFIAGIDAGLEKEEGSLRSDIYEGFSRGDRTRIELPAVQQELLRQLHATGKPVVLVNCSGCAMAIPWAAGNLPAIVQAWYPGEEGGTAVADVLFGAVNPAGRLPVTFYRSTDDLPPFDDYSMANRTYRYFTGKPLYAFGFGLSYTRFDYAGARVESDAIPPDGTLKLSFAVNNVGPRDGDEVAQVYFRRTDRDHDGSAPRQTLCGFARVHLATGQATTISIEIPAARFRQWDTQKKDYVVHPAHYELMIGASSDDIRLRVPVNVVPGQ